MESKELIVTMLCYIGVLLEICIEYVINRCHYFGWYELGFNCCVFVSTLLLDFVKFVQFNLPKLILTIV